MINAYNACSTFSKDCGTVAGATGGIQYPLILNKFCGSPVSMLMLVFNLVIKVRIRYQSLSVEQCIHVFFLLCIVIHLTWFCHFYSV